MDFYWEIIEHDGTVTDIPPDSVEVVRRRWKNNEPINLATTSIPANQIKKFQLTGRPYGQQPLLEAAAQAFKDPMYNPDGTVIVQWVKKHVPQREYTKHYGAIPSYRRLDEDRGMIVVAFRLPVHLIDTAKLDYCTPDEVQQLTRE